VAVRGLIAFFTEVRGKNKPLLNAEVAKGRQNPQNIFRGVLLRFGHSFLQLLHPK
jgi:hypothetical protein